MMIDWLIHVVPNVNPGSLGCFYGPDDYDSADDPGEGGDGDDFSADRNHDGDYLWNYGDSLGQNSWTLPLLQNGFHNLHRVLPGHLFLSRCN